MKFLHKNIKFLRQKAGYNIRDFTKLLDIPRSSLANYERGSHLPRLETLVAFSEALGVNIHDLIYHDYENETESSKTDNRAIAALWHSSLPKLNFQPYIFIIEDNSMLPLLEINDIVVSEKIDEKLNFEVGKVYALQTTKKVYFTDNAIKIGRNILAIPGNKSGEFQQITLPISALLNTYIARYRITEIM